MPDFIFAYHGGKKPETEQEGAEVMQRWQDWMETNKSAFVNPGNPVGMSKTVSAAGVEDHGGSNPLSGFSIVQADTIEAAVAIARSCPHLDAGTVEVAPIIEM
ncbi:YCII-related domain-containing protein [Roseibium hamelinense]|uniref:YCII-related domain-containing protein n=1 Tax=Roseibium hamelinense TaxID=150831 RepID=A0A562TH89_9HYPH|nr:YciI family protein [Roseibium hamelinense]MTI45843.1 hypothetical protein [Roseibium hamelinense]TWI92975.1 YCII-related domain-containing protein [Roseibium hamelinense]